MFKIGDRIVCINDSSPNDRPSILRSGGVYTVMGIYSANGITVVIDGTTYGMAANRFVLLSEFRRKKLNKIMSKVCHS